MDIDTMVENHFKKNRDIFGFESIAQLIEEVMDSMGALSDVQTLMEKVNVPTSESFDWNSIPEIPISELGWSDTRTKEVGGPQGGQRKLLEDYLDNIQGADIPEKLDNLNKFMSNPDIEGDTPGDKISKILGYLVFYKTLTRVITNFNASSAGFSFESFLAVLTGGEQIATGEGTIADYKTQDGEYVSLKLYQEGSVEVGGSWQDLVDDLADDGLDNRMTYIVVLKDLSGEGLDQEGTLRFFRFTITLDNVANFIDKSAVKSREVIILPLTKEGTLVDLAAAEPEAKAKLDEAIQRTKITADDFNKAMNQLAQENITTALKEFPDAAAAGPAFVDIMKDIQLGSSKFPRPTGAGVTSAKQHISAKIKEMLTDEKLAALLNVPMTPPGATRRKKLGAYLGGELVNAILGTIKALKDEPESARKTAGQELLKKYIKLDKKSADRSIAYYNGLAGDSEAQKKALFSSYGYLATKHFAVGKGVATGQVQVDGMPVEFMGQINIGASQIAPILEQARGELNDQVYGIFKNLKTLSTEINAYFASGLQDAKAGSEASRASKDIAKSTEEVTTQK
jgi:hypothetical protein